MEVEFEEFDVSHPAPPPPASLPPVLPEDSIEFTEVGVPGRQPTNYVVTADASAT